MKFLSGEWFEAVLGQVREEFSKPGKLTLTYCEVFNGCPGEESTKWMLLNIENGMLADAKWGTGDAPAAEYRGFAEYPDHIRMCQGKLNPKKAVLDGTIKIEDNVKAGPMRTLQLNGMYNRLVECKKISGTEY